MRPVRPAASTSLPSSVANRWDRCTASPASTRPASASRARVTQPACRKPAPPQPSAAGRPTFQAASLTARAAPHHRDLERGSAIPSLIPSRPARRDARSAECQPGTALPCLGVRCAARLPVARQSPAPATGRAPAKAAAPTGAAPPSSASPPFSESFLNYDSSCHISAAKFTEGRSRRSPEEDAPWN